MKNNLYRKSTVDPITQPLILPDQLSLLPNTILTLTSSLSQEDKQILSYFISCSSSNFSNNLGNCTIHNNNNNKSCYCFNCYMSYWVKWDSSPNHQLIHEIIDAFENMGLEKKKGKNKKQRRNKNRGSCGVEKNSEICEFECLEENSRSYDGNREEELGSVRRFVSFLGESIWSVWHV
ncbi:uncharacterized protein LOC129870796 [Solanum dulcamara]|uniref:uncharacterized protein LOC129870796 n=1 Tax=Solanum dulcamara TaxID=45834 RepID=UPI002485404B|nr:uncharacterized protein LOC129870796 [Solanum dulcamara]